MSYYEVCGVGGQVNPIRLDGYVISILVTEFLDRNHSHFQISQQPQTHGQKQNYQQCMSGFSNSAAGKATSSFSLLDLFDNLKEWFGFGAAKATGVGVLNAEASATVTDCPITAGTATTATTGLQTAVGSLLGGPGPGTAAEGMAGCVSSESPALLVALSWGQSEEL